MAATEGTSMTNIVEELIMGKRQNISNSKEQKKLTKGYTMDKSKEKVFKKDDPIFKEANSEEAPISNGKNKDLNIPF